MMCAHSPKELPGLHDLRFSEVKRKGPPLTQFSHLSKGLESVNWHCLKWDTFFPGYFFGMHMAVVVVCMKSGFFSSETPKHSKVNELNANILINKIPHCHFDD